jgi:hypothetical protein
MLRPQLQQGGLFTADLPHPRVWDRERDGYTIGSTARAGSIKFGAVWEFHTGGGER